MDKFKIFFYVAVAIGWYVLKNYNKVKQNRPVIMQEKKTAKDMVIEKIPDQALKQKIKPSPIQSKPELKKTIEEYKKAKEAKYIFFHIFFIYFFSFFIFIFLKSCYC